MKMEKSMNLAGFGAFSRASYFKNVIPATLQYQIISNTIMTVGMIFASTFNERLKVVMGIQHTPISCWDTKS
jgi:hypothetical protein